MKNKVILETDWLLDFFELKVLEESDLLKNWLSANYNLEPLQIALIEKLSKSYKKEGDAWNEEELKVRFLAHLLFLSDLEVPNKIKAFLERNLTADYKDYKISVDVDLMLASQKGLNTPKIPYFFLQELKKGKKSSNDPEAQMLAAMLAAQILHKDEKPVLGGYVVGRLWFFSVLEGKNYTLSPALDITKVPDLIQVICCLRKIKELVL
ncbi:MAG: hypothetical protein EAZ97_01960 [Bacteroidetes bacterium]|nr:MAG: hypothetical protein EAZ97_01960 [Bacteroidota bacterium]